MPDKPSKPTKLCPTCGTRVSEDAARCLVCGTDLTSIDKAAKNPKVVQGSRMPEVTLSLPAILGLFAMFLVIGAGLVYVAMRQATPVVAENAPSETPTITVTVTPTVSPTSEPPTATHTPEPSPTPQSYTIKAGDTCLAIATNFGVSVQSIVLLNDLPASCSPLTEGMTLLIPFPTPTATPPPTGTLPPEQATVAACETIEYTVAEGDTLGKIAAMYAVSKEAIAEWNGLVNELVRFDQTLVIPLCEREPTPGPTPPPPPPPPYGPPALLLPPDGAPFTLADETITLQWSAVGTLRSNEAYAVTIEDVTAQSPKLVEYVTDTKFIVPTSLRPTDGRAHTLRWTVITVRQVDTDEDGRPIWEAAGAPSQPRVFTWVGTGSAPESPSSGPEATPTP
ncbi:MAG: LysM peptidoglycan-binding domain-containing protein [Chloroflexi bacterium]|nr:LysM peptidoglycan-binding domain-containing protein [Chloroflexota bacterium]